MDASKIPVERIRPAARLTSEQRGIFLLALLLIALLLRAVPWLVNLPLHHDEALYGTWARAIADGSDPLLLIPWVDKPPLVLYLLAGSIKMLGTSELALRVPGLVACILTVWATFGLARRAVGNRAAWAAAGLMALSPFAILFGPTAFTDGWLTLFLTAAAWAALARRPGWAGVLLALACASKQQGVMGVPLVVALVIAAGSGQDGTKGHEERAGRSVQSTLSGLVVAAVGFAVVFGAVTYWDSLRWHNRPSYWDQSLRTYGGVVLAPLAEWPDRAVEWARQAGYWFGAWPVTAALLLAAALGMTRTGERIGSRASRSSVDSLSAFGAPRLLFLYIAGYLLVHLALTFQPWDRYLLPILPLVCILVGQGLVAAWDGVQRSSAVAARGMGIACAAALIFAASFGPTASIPVGADIGAYRGVADAARFLASQPPGTTVYFDRIGWHLGYYLYGLPITRSWYDSPQKLASETARVAAEHGAAAQWLALPAWEEPQWPALAHALATEGFVARPDFEIAGRNGTTDLTLYRLEAATLAAGKVDERDVNAEK